MKRSKKSRPLSNRPSCWIVYRPRLESLEARLPPGDLLLGRSLGAGALAAAAFVRPATPAADTPRVLPTVLSTSAGLPARLFSTQVTSAAPNLPAAPSTSGAVVALPRWDEALDPVAAADPLRGGGDLSAQTPARHFVNPGFDAAFSRGAGTSSDSGAAVAAPTNGVAVFQPPAGIVGTNDGTPDHRNEYVASALIAAGANASGQGALGSASSHGGVHALFHLDVQSEAPFPTNVFTVPDHTQNTNLRVNLPLPDCKVYVSDCEDLNVINTLDGFNLQPRLSIPFDGAIDANSVNSNDVFLISLGDTLNHHDHGGQVVGINQVVWDVATTTLHVESNDLLDQHTRYGLIVTNGIQDPDGNPVTASADFQHFRREVHGQYKHELEDAIHAARRAGVRERDIVAASVFTTESATAVLEKIRDQIHAATPDAADFNLGPDGERTVFNLDDMTGIHWEQQTGDKPPSFTPTELNLPALRVIPGAVGEVAFGKYLSPDYEIHTGPGNPGGEFIPPVGTRTGNPVVQGTNEIYFNLFLPSGPKPPGGWPVAIVGHGGGSSKNAFPLLYAGQLAQHGIASIGINIVGSGFGALGSLTVNHMAGEPVTFSAGGRGFDQNGDHVIGNNEGFAATAPRTILVNTDGFRQTVADLMQLVRVIEVGMDVNGDGSVDLDASRIYYVGQSLGGIYGTDLLALEPDIRAGVLISTGGSVNEYNRLSPARVGRGNVLAARIPSLLNSPGVTVFGGLAIGSPRFNENVPLRDGVPLAVSLDDGTSHVIQAPVINDVPGAMAIQEVFDNIEWVSQPANAVAYAPHLRTAPLPGVPGKSVILIFGKGDETIPNPAETAVVRAGNLADRTTFYRNDLAYAEDPAVPRDPHTFMNGILNPALAAIALSAQDEEATFLASDGQTIIHPEPARFFETPIHLPLPEDLNYIP